MRTWTRWWVAVVLAVVVGRVPAGAGEVEVLIRTVPNRMVFDRTKLYVEAGKAVVLVVENRDILAHNLVLMAPGALVEVGMAAERMAGTPDAEARGFVPESPRVLHALTRIEPGQVGRLAFRAPARPGEYPFACTLPGHWRIMNGVMAVVERLADVPAEALRAPAAPSAEGRPFVHRWTVDDLVPELGGLDGGRSFARGRAMFHAAACVQCHKVRGEGGELGPDLSGIPAKRAAGTLDRAGVLREVIEPSWVIEPRYRPVLIETRDGGIVSGIVVGRDAGALRVQSGPHAEPRRVPIDAISEQIESKVSIMPEGLLVTLSKEEILDLLAYVMAGGDPRDRSFGR